MSIRTRLWLTGMLMLLIVAVLSGILLWQVWRDLQRDQREIQGVEQIRAVSEILRYLPEHRGRAGAVLSGETDSDAEAWRLSAQVSTHMGFLRLLAQNGGLDRHQVDELVAEWETLDQSWRGMTAAESFSRHSRLIGRVLDQIRRITARSGLANDADESVYHLTALLARGVPQFIQTAGQVRAFGAGPAARHHTDAGDVAVFKHLRDEMRGQMARIMDARRALQSAGQLGAGDLNAAFAGLLDDTQTFVGEVDWLLATQAKEAEVEPWFQTANRVIDSAMHLSTLAGAEIQHRLKARMAQTRQWGATLLGAALAMLAALFVLLHAVIRRITAPLSRAVEVVGQVAAGDLGVSIGLHGNDEVGQLSRGIDEMVVKLAENRAELDAMRQAEIAAMQEREHLLAQATQQARLVTLGEMATGMMHEINQPLTYISATVQTLRRAQRKGMALPEEKLAEMLMQSMQQIDRIGTIMQHLRTFGRADAAEVFTAVDWDAVLDNALLLIGSKLADAGIELTRDIADPLPRVTGNENAFEQVLLNLLQNAMQALAGREDGRIEIAMRVEEGREKGEGGRVEIRLSDNGVGMSPEVRDKCFEPFYTTRGTGQGTGIGLSLAHGIVTQHGGTIAVESEPGVGTTFILRFPVLAAA